MAVVVIWDPLNRLLWGIAITVVFIAGVQYFIKGRKLEAKNEKILMYGFALTFLCFTSLLISRYFIDIFTSGTFINGTFYGEIPQTYQDISDDWIIAVKIGNFSGIIGMIIFFLAFEISTKRTKYLITTINLIPSLIYIIFFVFLNNFAFDFLSLILDYFHNIILALILYYITKWSRLEFKSISFLLLFGYILFTRGIFLDSIAKKFSVIFLYLPPVIVIIGILVLISPLIIKTEVFSRALNFWKILGILIISFQILMSFYLIISGIPIIFIFINDLIGLIVIILLIYFIIKNIKSELIPGHTEAVEVEIPDILRAFPKPQTITEEEVTFHKEKKICLVCKGKLAGFMFMCVNCGALYCENCSRALSDVENMCWVCSTPFDETKPVRFPKKAEETVFSKEANQKFNKDDK